MSRMYGEPVEVARSGGRPVRFVWRGRLFLVRRVLEHWVTRSADAEDPAERRFWRVEATSDSRRGVYELRLDTASGRWLLSRAWD